MAEWTNEQHERIKQVLHDLGYLRHETLVLDNGLGGMSFGDVCDAIEEIERLKEELDDGLTRAIDAMTKRHELRLLM